MTPNTPAVQVALLRGVNVGGHNRVPMADLRRTVEAIGCTEVTTYIQSGNVVLTSPLASAELRRALEEAVAQQLGVSATVMVRSAAEIAAVVATTPYPDASEGTVHVAFLHEPPTADEAAGLARAGDDAEQLAVRGREIYLHLPQGIGRSRLAVEMGKHLRGPCTVRNWRTVGRLRELSAR